MFNAVFANCAIITAIALVMIVCVAALGMRSALLVGIAIPTSFMIGFLIVFLSGRSVDNMLMFGMVLTVGMLVCHLALFDPGWLRGRLAACAPGSC